MFATDVTHEDLSLWLKKHESKIISLLIWASNFSEGRKLWTFKTTHPTSLVLDTQVTFEDLCNVLKERSRWDIQRLREISIKHTSKEVLMFYSICSWYFIRNQTFVPLCIRVLFIYEYLIRGKKV